MQVRTGAPTPGNVVISLLVTLILLLIFFSPLFLHLRNARNADCANSMFISMPSHSSYLVFSFFPPPPPRYSSWLFRIKPGIRTFYRFLPLYLKSLTFMPYHHPKIHFILLLLLGLLLFRVIAWVALLQQFFVTLPQINFIFLQI